MKSFHHIMVADKPWMVVLKLLSIILAVALAINLAIFAWVINPDHLQGDQWRWIRQVVIPYNQGKISFFEAVTHDFSVFSHSHILTLSEMLLNERFFGLNQRLSTLIGVPSIIGCFALYFSFFRKKIANTDLSANYDAENVIWFSGFIAVCAATLFSIGPFAAFTWSLVTFEHLYLFMAMTLIFFFPSLFSQQKRLPLLLLLTVTFVFGDAMGNAAVLTTVVMAILMTLYDRSLWKIAALYIIALVCLTVIGKILFTGQVTHGRMTNLGAFQYAITHLEKTFDFLFSGIGRSLVPAPPFMSVADYKVRGLSRYAGMFICIVAMYLSIWTLTNKRIRENAIPLMLIGFSLICIIGAVRLRIDRAELAYVMSDRYYRLVVPFYLGTLWLAYDFWSQKLRRIGTLAFGSFALGHILFLLWISVYSWTSITPSINNLFDNWDEALLQYGVDGNFEYNEMNPRCRDGFCNRAIIYLRSNELSTFRTESSPGNRD